MTTSQVPEAGRRVVVTSHHEGMVVDVDPESGSFTLQRDDGERLSVGTRRKGWVTVTPAPDPKEPTGTDTRVGCFDKDGQLAYVFLRKCAGEWLTADGVHGSWAEVVELDFQRRPVILPTRREFYLEATEVPPPAVTAGWPVELGAAFYADRVGPGCVKLVGPGHTSARFDAADLLPRIQELYHLTRRTELEKRTAE